MPSKTSAQVVAPRLHPLGQGAHVGPERAAEGLALEGGRLVRTAPGTRRVEGQAERPEGLAQLGVGGVHAGGHQAPTSDTGAGGNASAVKQSAASTNESFTTSRKFQNTVSTLRASLARRTASRTLSTSCTCP